MAALRPRMIFTTTANQDASATGIGQENTAPQHKKERANAHNAHKFENIGVMFQRMGKSAGTAEARRANE